MSVLDHAVRKNLEQARELLRSARPTELAVQSSGILLTLSQLEGTIEMLQRTSFNLACSVLDGGQTFRDLARTTMDRYREEVAS